MFATIRRLVFAGAIVLVFLILVGATYQGVVTALERRQFPHPGRMLDVGGHQLHLDCRGRGTPTVVLEAPAIAMSSAWGWVQADLQRTTRVCSYDRAGLGWSESGDAPYSPTAVPAELNRLLMNAGEQPPFVLAGVDLGAAFATIYAARYPGDVAGLVLINAGPFATGASTPSIGFLKFSPWLARVGILRATRTISASASALPPASAGALRTFLNRPDHLTRAAAELARRDETLAMSDGAALAPALPVTRVNADGIDEIAAVADRANADRVTAAIRRALRGTKELGN